MLGQCAGSAAWVGGSAGETPGLAGVLTGVPTAEELPRVATSSSDWVRTDPVRSSRRVMSSLNKRPLRYRTASQPEPGTPRSSSKNVQSGRPLSTGMFHGGVNGETVQLGRSATRSSGPITISTTKPASFREQFPWVPGFTPVYSRVLP